MAVFPIIFNFFREVEEQEAGYRLSRSRIAGHCPIDETVADRCNISMTTGQQVAILSLVSLFSDKSCMALPYTRFNPNQLTQDSHLP
jgi:hypothetical protein